MMAIDSIAEKCIRRHDIPFEEMNLDYKLQMIKVRHAAIFFLYFYRYVDDRFTANVQKNNFSNILGKIRVGMIKIQCNTTFLCAKFVKKNMILTNICFVSWILITILVHVSVSCAQSIKLF